MTLTFHREPTTGDIDITRLVRRQQVQRDLARRKRQRSARRFWLRFPWPWTHDEGTFR